MQVLTSASILLLTSASAVLSTPLVSRLAPRDSVPAASTFGLQARHGDQNYTLGWVYNGNDTNTVVLVSDHAILDASAYLNTTTTSASQGYAALNILVEGNQYGLSAADLGIFEGAEQTIYGTAGAQQFEWAIDNDSGYISHKLTQPDEGFYLCARDVNSHSTRVLSWVSENGDGSVSEECFGVGLYRVPHDF